MLVINILHEPRAGSYIVCDIHILVFYDGTEL